MLSSLQKKLHLTSKKLLFFQNSPVVLNVWTWLDKNFYRSRKHKVYQFYTPLNETMQNREQILGVYPFSNTVILCQDLDETSKSKVILFISLSVYNVTNTISSEEKKKRRASTKVCGWVQNNNNKNNNK